jgi:glycosyltransferase involved in cell wall biosynthesis
MCGLKVAPGSDQITQTRHTSPRPTEAATRRKLLIISSIARADLVEPFKWFRRFEVWHLYRKLDVDTSPARLDSRTIAFRNPFDLLLKIVRIKPSLIQGSEPYDVPHGFWLCCVTLLAARMLRTPYYFPTLENVPPESKFRERRGIRVGRLLVPLLRNFMRIYARRALLIFAINKGAVRNLISVGAPRGRIRRELYGTWGVDLDLFSPRNVSSTAGCGERRQVLFIGRIIRAKGIPELLEAFLHVRQQAPATKLSFVGDGPMVSDIRAFARTHGLEDAILLHGVVPNQDLPPFIVDADVLVSPSVATPTWAEQVGMVNIQSMACGTPVVSTKSGSIEEFVEDGKTGVLVEECDPDALAQAIMRVMTDRALHHRLSVNARAFSVERYDAKRNVDAVEAVLVDRLAARPGRGHWSG